MDGTPPDRLDSGNLSGAHRGQMLGKNWIPGMLLLLVLFCRTLPKMRRGEFTRPGSSYSAFGAPSAPLLAVRVRGGVRHALGNPDESSCDRDLLRVP